MVMAVAVKPAKTESMMKTTGGISNGVDAMKQTFKSLAAFAAMALSLVACQKEVEAPQEEVAHKHSIVFTAGTPETKTTVANENGKAVYSWENSDLDLLHIYEDGEEGEIDKEKSTISAKSLEVTADFYSDPDENEHVYTATLNGGIPTDQLSDGKYDPTADVLVSYPVTSVQNQSISFNFKRVSTVHRVTLKGLADLAGQSIETIEITSESGLVGTYTANADPAAEGTWNLAAEQENKVVVYTVEEIPAEGSVLVYFVTRPLENAALTFTLTTEEGYVYTKSTPAAITLAASDVTSYSVTLAFDHQNPVTKTVEETIESIADRLEWENSQQYNSFALNSIVSITSTDSGNNGKYYTSGENYRLYQGDNGEMTISLKSGFKILECYITYTVDNTGVLLYNEQPVTSEESINGVRGRNSITFQVGNTTSATNGQARISAIKVKYTSDEIEKLDATTLFDPEEVEVMVGSQAVVDYETDYDGVLTVAVSPETAADAVIDTEKNTITITGKAVTAEATITISGTETENYKAVSEILPLTVIAKQVIDPTVTIADSATVEEESSVSLDLTINNDYDGTITAVSAAEVTATASYADGKVTINGIAQGSTTVTVSAEATENYNAFSKTISVTVVEKAISRVITLANGQYSGSSTMGIITWDEGVYSAVQAKGTSGTSVNQSYVAQPRFYVGNTITFTPAAGITIKKIEFQNPSTSGKFTCTVGEMSESGLVWTGSSTDAIVLSAETRTDMSNNNSAIVVYYIGEVSKTDATLTFSDTSIEIEENSDEEVTVTTNYNGTLTPSSSADAIATATYDAPSRKLIVSGKSEGDAVITLTGTGSLSYNDISQILNVHVKKAATGGTVVSFGTTNDDDYKWITGNNSSNSLANTSNIKAGQVELTFTGTSYFDGSVVRFYQNNTMTVTPKQGATITKVVITRQTTTGSNDGNISAKIDAVDQEVTGSTTTTNTWKGSTTSAIVFTASAQARFTKVEVTYAPGSDPEPEVTLKSIAVKTAPSKVTYTEGEKFDPAGLVITKTMSDNSTEDVTYNDATKSGFTFTPDLQTELQTSDKSVTITYGEKSADQSITVNAATPGPGPDPGTDYATTYTSNVTLPSSGTNVSSCTVVIDGQYYSAAKFGNSKKNGTATFTIPGGTTKVHLHLAGWKGDTCSAVIKNGSTQVFSSGNLTCDNAITGNETSFSLTMPDGNYYYSFDVSNITEETTLTITSTKRFVLFGVNAE